jgi:hypothetical protein
VAEFGCAACYGEDADATWHHYHDGLPVTEQLILESHFVVGLRRCAACEQPFVWVFTEYVDWQGGEDPQYRVVVPITPAEAATLAEQGENVDLPALGALGRGRRYLSVDWPSDAPLRAYWGSGAFRPEPGH